MGEFVEEVAWNQIAIYVFDRVGNVSPFAESVSWRKTTQAIHLREKMSLEVVYKNKKGKFQEILKRNRGLNDLLSVRENDNDNGIKIVNISNRKI